MDRSDAATGDPPPVFDLRAAKVVLGDFALNGDELSLTTGPEQWTYTAVVAPAFPADLAGWRARLRLAAEAEAGVVEIGVLDGGQTRFVASVLVASGPEQTIELITPELAQTGALVLRNASAEGVSRARCRLLGVDLAPPFAQFGEFATPAEVQAARMAEAFGAAAARLGEALRRLDDSAAALQGWKRRGEAGLRAALGGLGMMAPDVGDERLAAIFAALDADRLVDLASALAPAPALAPVPGWTFSSFRASPDPAVLVRYALWLALAHKNARRAIVVPWFSGVRLHLSPATDLSLALFVGGTFEPNEFYWLNSVLAPGMTFIDGGANEGAYTLFAAVKLGERGRVIAIEPSPRELERLRANVLLAGLENVEIVPAALAEQSGAATLRIAESLHSGLNTLGSFPYDNVRLDHEAPVTAVTLDEMVAAKALKRIDAIKLDIEGSELRALRGGRETLRRFRPVVVFEANVRSLQIQGSALDEVFAFFEAEDYALHVFDGHTGLLEPLVAQSGFDNVIATPRSSAS